ncbi:MAG: type II toxin-antitoxin system VapC family toxin [Chthoniobacterales bacterium]|nr:type II toxin-antitoxin system VapC family toxin [Chthoniobacterales bacterium]
MQILDVNILVYAYRADAPEHPLLAPFLQNLIDGDLPFGIPKMAFSSLVRIVTQPKLHMPATTTAALDFCNSVMRSPRCLVLRPTERHWPIFDRLCRAADIRGKRVADAYLAAFALDSDGEWITTDRDFARFPGLRWRHPLESRVRTNPG